MKSAGLTGGIGSGKTTVSKIFEQLGITVFNSDIEAGKLMITDNAIIEALKTKFGASVYLQDHSLNKPLLRDLIFNNPEARSYIDSVVHPKVWESFRRWSDNSLGPYVIMESALLFQTGFYKALDYIVVVDANLDVRTKRLAIRDNIAESEARSRIVNQNFNMANDKEHYTITNNSEMLLPQILNIHNIIIDSL